MTAQTHSTPTDRTLLPRSLIKRGRARAPFFYSVTSDSMAPTYRPHQNSVICVPVARYTCEGVYLIDGDLFRCERRGNYVEVWTDNPAGTKYRIHIDLFNGSQLALVVADITARNAIGTDMLRDTSFQ
jgi:hypothetical protein